MAHIDYFLAPQSPYVWLAGRRPADIAARHGATIAYRPVDLAQLFPRTGGKVRAERHPSRVAWSDRDRMRQARKLGVEMLPAPMFRGANPAPASYAIIAAQAAGGGDLAGLVAGIARTLWAGDRDISDDEVIREVLAANGFDPGVADRGMLMAADTYSANLEEAVLRGVFGAPFFLVGEEAFWGQDRLDDLDAHLAGRL
ncbi:MAG: 2-hydroxychromene-2-carboxylate isomerase [Paracoccaceae bacterium]